MMKQREGRWSSRACVALVIAAGCLGSGCDLITEKITQKVAEKAIEHTIEKQSGGDVQVDTSNGSVSVKSDKGTVEISGAGAKLPDTWPKDVPLYPGATITMAISNDKQHMLGLETADSPEQAVAFYKDKLASMKQEVAMSTPQQEMLAYEDGNGRVVQLAIGKESGGAGPDTTIALIVSPPTKPAAQ